MITEDYVSFEVAKLLKEKGFNEKCRGCYHYEFDNNDNPVVMLEEWMAGNVAVAYSRDDTLRRLQKQTAHTKIDCYHALLDAIYIFDLSEGKTE